MIVIRCISAPADHIKSLASKWEEGNKELADIQQRLESADEQSKADLEMALTNLRTVSIISICVLK